MKKQVKNEKHILLECTMIKGWYLCCYKCQHRNLNVYPNVATFLKRRASIIP